MARHPVGIVPRAPVVSSNRHCRRARPSVRLRRHLSTGHPRQPLLNTTRFLDHAIAVTIAVAAPTFHGRILNIPKVSTIVIQLTTHKNFELCNNPRSDSVPRTCILQYHIRFADARSPTHNLRAVFNGAVGPSPLSSASNQAEVRT